MQASRLNWGLVFIILGLAALGWSTGHLPFEVVWRLLNLWPVLLIAIGIQMIFSRSKASGFAYLSSIIIVLAAVYAVAPYWDQVRTGMSRERESGKFEQQIGEGINVVEVNADFANRDFTLDNSTGPGMELEYNHELVSPSFRYRALEGVGKLNLDKEDYRIWRIFRKSELPRWKLNLPEDYPLKLYLKSRDGYCYLRMADLDISSLNLECPHCYDVVLQFGKMIPEKPVIVDAKRSTLRVELPPGISVRLRDGARMPYSLTENLNYIRDGDDLVSDSMMIPDSVLTLDIAPGLRELIINRH
jgi:hypothetical protein